MQPGTTQLDQALEADLLQHLGARHLRHPRCVRPALRCWCDAICGAAVHGVHLRTQLRCVFFTRPAGHGARTRLIAEHLHALCAEQLPLSEVGFSPAIVDQVRSHRVLAKAPIRDTSESCPPASPALSQQWPLSAQYRSRIALLPPACVLKHTARSSRDAVQPEEREHLMELSECASHFAFLCATLSSLTR